MDIDSETQVDSQPRSYRDFSATFNVMLCIYFVFLFRISLGAVSQLRSQIIHEILISETPGLNALYYLSYFLWLAFGFWAVVLMLKESRCAIRSMKLCLPYHFFAFLIATLPKAASFSFGTWWLPLCILFYPLIFLLYICSSKEVKERFPKEERRWGIPGAVGLFLYGFLAVILIFSAASGVITESQGNKVDVSKISLHGNEITDGRVIFMPEPAWKQDSTATLNTVMDAFYFHDTLSLSRIMVVCAKEEYEPSRHYYIYSIFENQPFDTRYYSGEVDFHEWHDEQYLIYVDQYKYRKDSTDYYWTYASKIGKKNSKAVRISIVDKDSLRTSVDDAVRILDKSTLDIKGRLFKNDCIDKENNNKNPDEVDNPAQPVSKQ